MGFVFHKSKKGPVAFTEYDVKLRRHKDKNGRVGLSVYLSARIIRKARWVVGDRVYFGIDEELHLCAVQRTTEKDGFKLLPTSPSTQKTLTSPVYFRFATTPELISEVIQDGVDVRFLYEGEVELDDTMVMFDSLKRKGAK